MKGAIAMKKSNLWWALGFMAAGAAFFLTGLLWQTRLSGILCGIGGGWLFNGAVQLWRYAKWTRPENAAAYRERLEQQRIDLHDERKELLRNKSGRYAYLLGLAVCCAAIFLFSILGVLGVLEGCRPLILFLGAYVVFQYGAGVVIYRRLERRC